MKKKLKTTQQQKRRLKKKVTDLSEVINTLQEGGYISTGCADVLQKFSGATKELFERALENTAGRSNKEYPPELRSFAMTLQFYSAKAYKFVRKSFNLALPHPSVIRGWYSTIPGAPGFTEPAFSALKLRVAEAAKRGHKVLSALMLDEMAIRKHVQFDGKQFHGYVSIGNDMYDDSTPLAKDALVIMAVAVNDSWKVPCGYFLIDGMSGKERANLIQNCIERLHEAGVQVVSLTCDGPSCHFSMMKELGANVDPFDMRPFFPHPSNPAESIYIFLDACHMLKLTRNTLGDLRTLADRDGGLIHWGQIEALNALQESEGLHLANKLRNTHLHWRKQKMKVHLAAQTLSNSVADAIEFCAKNLKLRPFLASESTVKFIRMFNQLFDILNSRHPLAKGSKGALRVGNIHIWGPFLTEAEHYILGLQDSAGQPLVKSRRKTAFVGFLACIASVRGLFQSHVASQDAPLKYLLTYKFSQDHLELFFCAVRACGRGNNNPTAQQFTAAYKRLLMKHNIDATGGNCTALDNTHILDALPHDPTSSPTGQLPLTLSDVSVARRYGLPTPSVFSENESHELAVLTQLADVNEYKEAVIAYVAGYVCRMVKEKLSCTRCTDALCADDGKCHSFIGLKDKGGLQKPSESVVLTCQETEKNIRQILHTTNNKLPQGPNVPHAIASSVLSVVRHKVFKTLDDHAFDTAVEENHIHILVKTVSLCFCNLRFHHLAKQFTKMQNGASVRKQFSKLVLFKHQ